MAFECGGLRRRPHQSDPNPQIRSSRGVSRWDGMLRLPGRVQSWRGSPNLAEVQPSLPHTLYRYMARHVLHMSLMSSQHRFSCYGALLPDAGGERAARAQSWTHHVGHSGVES